MFIERKKCVFCGSKNLIKLTDQSYNFNYYTKYLSQDLKISKKKLNQIHKYQCNKCFIIQNNPWFKNMIVRKIYSNIYGQHHRAWTNLIDYFEKDIKPNHGKLYELINKRINLKSYAEFNSPFMGLFFDFFDDEFKKYKKKKFFFYNDIFNYLTSRQLAGKSDRKKKLSFFKSKKLLNKIEKFKSVKKTILKEKHLITHESPMFWNENDNYRSVNSRTYARELLDINFLDMGDLIKSKIKFDLIGIFHTLDHTYDPKFILDTALSKSKFVLVYCHVDPKMNKQHLFSFTKKFLSYLRKKKIYTVDITDNIEKNFSSPELYFICSKSLKDINKFNGTRK